MAHSRTKAGGANRGRKLTKKMGMNSGRLRARQKAASKGKRG